MSGPWFACLIVDQLLCVTVVSTYEHLSVNFFEGFYCSAYAAVNSLDCFYCCSLYTGMTNHIRVCKVDDDHIVFVRFDRIYKFVADFRCAHFRLKIIGSNLRRFYKDSVLTFVWLFHTTVEEERNVSIFLCLSDTNLCHIMSCKVFAKCILKKYFVEGNQFVLDCLIIVCKTYICEVKFLCSLEAFELVIAECSGDLTCTVRTEVEEYNGIFVLNGCNRFAVFFDYSRKYEFICLVSIVGSLNCCCSVCAFDAFAFCQCFVCKLYTIPAVISVHCIVTSGNNTDLTNTDFFHLCFKLFDEFFTGCRRSVTSVKEAMYINFLKSLSFSHLKQCIEMSIVAVYTTIGKKSHEVNSGIIIFCILHCCKKCFVLEEITIVDLFCDSGKLLIYDTACAHIHMTYLRVTHLSVRKTNCKSAGISFYEWIFCH